MDEEDYRKAKAYALRRLSSQSYLSRDLKQSMLRKEFSAAHIDKILIECQELGYLNDDEWLDAFVRGMISKRKGPRAIASKLFQKGIPRDKIQEIVQQIKSGESQEENIRDLLRTKHKNKDLSNYKEKQKVIASLARRGFTFDDILKVIK